MPIMFPGSGTPTIRWRTSPATQMAKMTASWSGILMTAVKVENGAQQARKKIIPAYIGHRFAVFSSFSPVLYHKKIKNMLQKRIIAEFGVFVSKNVAFPEKNI